MTFEQESTASTSFGDVARIGASMMVRQFGLFAGWSMLPLVPWFVIAPQREVPTWTMILASFAYLVPVLAICSALITRFGLSLLDRRAEPFDVTFRRAMAAAVPMTFFDTGLVLAVLFALDLHVLLALALSLAIGTLWGTQTAILCDEDVGWAEAARRSYHASAGVELVLLGLHGTLLAIVAVAGFLMFALGRTKSAAMAHAWVNRTPPDPLANVSLELLANVAPAVLAALGWGWYLLARAALHHQRTRGARATGDANTEAPS